VEGGHFVFGWGVGGVFEGDGFDAGVEEVDPRGLHDYFKNSDAARGLEDGGAFSV